MKFHSSVGHSTNDASGKSHIPKLAQTLTERLGAIRDRGKAGAS
jgi:hypothetical protein